MIKNYTSTVPVSRTIARIEEKLAMAGVSGIHKTYGPDGQVDAVDFTLELANQTFSFRLPINAQAVYERLRKKHVRTKKEVLLAQANRTAWKVMQDWVEVQLTLIELQKVDFLQVFMPYLLVGRFKTLYHELQERRFKGLLEDKR